MKYVTVKRISEITSLKEKTLYDWAVKGKIPCRKVGKLVRFVEEEVVAWMESKKVVPEEKLVDNIIRSIYSRPIGRPSRLGKKVRS
ncbi:MAG: helix-turn-helix domain-containing protein [Nitrospirae bacterium]|nr:helix-turn-helix domain-containing protein [Nitrospirota bacterium]